MEKKPNKFLDLLDRVVQAKYSVPAWLWTLVSLMVGLIVTGYAFLSPLTYVEFLAALPVAGMLIGPIVVLGAVLALYGMARDKPKWTRIGSFVSFCVWVFLGIAFYITGGWVNVFILPFWMQVFWGYKYLASWVREEHGI